MTYYETAAALEGVRRGGVHTRRLGRDGGRKRRFLH
jgi:hypothetical protein